MPDVPGSLAVVAAVVLAGTFTVAAILKFRDPAATRQSLANFGLPNPRLLAIAVPVTELTTALLLVVDRRTGGPCAVALLVAFTTLRPQARRGVRICFFPIRIDLHFWRCVDFCATLRI